MMLVDITDKSLPVYKALANSVRLHIIRLLCEHPYSVKGLAEQLGLSQPLTLRHVNQLQEAGLINFTKDGKSKISHISIDEVKMEIPHEVNSTLNSQRIDIPVGLFNDFEIKPTCGLADLNGYIGHVDEPKYFLDSKRMNARILWFTQGFVEYQIGNYLSPSDHVEMITLSAEMGSEIPLSNSDWPSDITFTLNDHLLGTWTSPGDFADTRGKYTPLWTPAQFNQYGTMLTVLISNKGTWIGGKMVSNTTISDLTPLPSRLKLRISVEASAEHVGGCTIFGKGFGNSNQDMYLTMYYSS
ncbi:ArsR/SmtB family transcription factor [Levilactobacillus cerevisiae]|uniref:ArsR/SmtB family transcription factor n=1 Tax=Levilactobacillus cerevisiae TaxID=1704076 RepID=UPI00345F05B8